MPTPIQIQAPKLEIPYSLSQLDNKKNEIAALVESLGLTFEGEQNLYTQLIALGIEQVKLGEQYDSIDLTKGAAAAPVTLQVTERPKVGLSVDTASGTAIVAVESKPSLAVSIQESQAVKVETKRKLIVSLVNQNVVSPTPAQPPVSSIDMKSQDGTLFTVVVSNDGQLLVIPQGSTAPQIITLPTTTGTEKVWYTLAAIAGDVTGSPTPTRTWQWQRSANGTDWSNITGATTTTYTLEAADANNYIRVQQTETNVLGSITASSAATGLIAASIFSTTQYQNITPITWEALTTQTWN